jgi:hypothetical protein
MAMMSLRILNADEIEQLEDQGCRAEDWRQVHVATGFIAARVQDSRFYGAVELGRFSSELEVEPGVFRPSGIYNSTLEDCRIADEVRVAGVGELVRYDIEGGVVLQQIGSLLVEGESCFGNGTALDILNEGGGRALPMFDRLSAPLAYCLVHYRHASEAIARIEELIHGYCAVKCARRGRIGRYARILRCGTLRNVVVGPYAEIAGAAELVNGTLASVEDDPVRIGPGVIARDFIVQSGSHIGDGVLLSHCFVGQGVRLGKQFSAEHSAFFANCDGFHGEALSLFAGPYTVTHHKSTLLIAAGCSFFNAGSSSNQSNHMYKLGPLHQGIFERGAKTGSGSYLLWPCRIGAFSAVIGKHAANFDSSDLPFSYIDVHEGRTFVTPAMNLFSAGTGRDSVKWPERDRRKDPDKRDRIHFALFNPYVINRVLRAIDLLDRLAENTPREQETVAYKGVLIKRLLLKGCRKYYEMVVQLAIGQALAARLEACEQSSWPAMRSELAAGSAPALEEWVDLSGLLVPQRRMEELLGALRTGEAGDLAQLDELFESWYRAYDQECWSFMAALIEKRLGLAWTGMAPGPIRQLIVQWREQAVKLNNLMLMDAQKEFDAGSRIGYGVDGGEEIASADFAAVRGTYAEHPFVRKLQRENERIGERADALLARLEALSP